MLMKMNATLELHFVKHKVALEIPTTEETESGKWEVKCLPGLYGETCLNKHKAGGDAAQW